VVRLPVYSNRAPAYTAGELDELFEPAPELVAFTSSSTVSHLVQILRASGREGLLAGIQGACIGPITAATARELGLAVRVESGTHTIPGLIQAIEEHFRERQSA
jgi:uroporphyrinogen-III synthase